MRQIYDVCVSLTDVSVVFLTCLCVLVAHIRWFSDKDVCFSYVYTLLQVRERLKREQANRTSKRIRELLDSGNSDSESDSEEEQISSIDMSSDTLSLLRRDLYLGLLWLLLLIVLQNYWVGSTFLGK